MSHILNNKVKKNDTLLIHDVEKVNSAIKKMRPLITGGLLILSIAVTQTASAAVFSKKGNLYIENKSSCNIVLDSHVSQDNDFGSATYNSQTIKPGKKSKKIAYSVDSGPYGNLEIDANASCQAQVNSSLNFWSIITRGKLKGKFNTEASCNSAISARGQASSGIFPEAYILIPGYTADSDGNKIKDFNVLVSRESNNSITISASNFLSDEVCGADKGLYVFSGPKVLNSSVTLVRNNFNKYTTRLSENKSIFFNAVQKKFLLSEISENNDQGSIEVEDSRFASPNLKLSSADKRQKDEGFTLNLIGLINLEGRPFLTKNHLQFSRTINIAKLSDAEKLKMCFQKGSSIYDENNYIIYPTIENPNNEECENF